MPDPVDLPFHIRPFGVRIAAAVASGAIVFVVTVLWLALSDDVKAMFDPFQRLTLVLVFVAMIVLLYGLFRTSALATEEGLRVTNGYKTRRLEWAQIVRITLTRNRPWALLDLDNGTTVSLMAIQTSDGDHARRAARRLATVIAERSRTSRDD